MIGETPVVRLDSFAPNLIGKIEAFNPAGSVTERIAVAMLDRARDEGLIDAEMTIVEPTSGDTSEGRCHGKACNLGTGMAVV